MLQRSHEFGLCRKARMENDVLAKRNRLHRHDYGHLRTRKRRVIKWVGVVVGKNQISTFSAVNLTRLSENLSSNSSRLMNLSRLPTASNRSS